MRAGSGASESKYSATAETWATMGDLIRGVTDLNSALRVQATAGALAGPGPHLSARQERAAAEQAIAEEASRRSYEADSYAPRLPRLTKGLRSSKDVDQTAAPADDGG